MIVLVLLVLLNLMKFFQNNAGTNLKPWPAWRIQKLVFEWKQNQTFNGVYIEVELNFDYHTGKLCRK